MGRNRTQNSIINIITSFLNKFVGQILSFVVRTVFIRTLAIEYLGMNGLFSSILGMLSLAELGIGGAMVFLMYKPVAEKNEEDTLKYLTIYKKVYRIVGCFVLIVGLSLTPFLDFFIKEKPDIPELTIIYILYVINSALSYFVGAYKQGLYQADQKIYKITNISIAYNIIFSVLQILSLLMFKNYLIYFILGMLQIVAINLTLSYKIRKDYPFITQKVKKKLEKFEVSYLVRTIKGVFYYKLSAMILNSTDSILVSKFVSLVAVGKYSNYSTIITIIRTFAYMVFDGIMPSLGNLCAKDDCIGKRKVFRELMYLNIWISGASAICLLMLLNPFISIWAGEMYLLDKKTVLVLCIVYYIQTTLRTTGTFRDAAGLFYEARWSNIWQCVINLFVSVLFANKMGITGIFLGTIVALMTTLFWVQPYLVNRYVLQQGKKELLYYYVRYLCMTSIWCVGYGIVQFFVKIFNITNIIWLAIFAISVPNILFLAITCKSLEFELLLKRAKSLLKRGVD